MYIILFTKTTIINIQTHIYADKNFKNRQILYKKNNNISSCGVCNVNIRGVLDGSKGGSNDQGML